MSNAIWSKTAPCLLQQLHDYNFLGSFADLFIPGSGPSPCQHLYATNPDRSSVPQSQDERPQQSTKWTLALTCQLCRVHIDCRIDFGDSQLPCPNDESPLHHFCSTPTLQSSDESYPRQYQFKCSFPYCQASLWVLLRPPELPPDEVGYLIDVQPRMKAVLERLPKTKNRNSLEALDVFRTYIRDCLWNSGRTIPTDNGAFASCLGDGAATMLLRLGFIYAQDENGKPAWKLPQPHPHDKADAAFDMTRCALEDVREELTVLIQARPESEKRGTISDMYPPPPGTGKRDLERLFGASEYETIPPTSRWNQIGSVDLYCGLGALPDYADPLIAWCYDLQSRSDASQGPFFFRCLKEIAECRQSEMLATKALTLESQGIRTDAEINEAFEIIGIEASHSRFLNDENILSKYQSRFQDSGVEARQRMRNALAIIGEYRRSPTLRDAATGTLETYEQALAYLGAQPDTLDEFILALKTAKEQEPLIDKLSVSKAVEIIATARNSSVLNAHLQDESQAVPKMDVNTAYNIFGADPAADSDTLTLAFPGLLHDNPERRDEIIRAMKAIAEARDNNELLQQAQSALQASATTKSFQPTPVGEPRGLENIGNTCYLNSFLQYLYTIKPLRDLVQNMEEYHQDSSQDALSSKRVSDEPVNRHQVLRAQSFVQELSNLFDALRTSRNRAVTLERSLAALTVAPTGDWTAIREQEKRRRSTMVSSKPPKFSISTALANNQAGEPQSLETNTTIVESPLEERFVPRMAEEVAMPNGGTSGSVDNQPERGEDTNEADMELPLARDALDIDDAEPMNMDAELQGGQYDSIPRNDIGDDRISEPILPADDPELVPQSPSAPPAVPPRRALEEAKQFQDASTEKIEEWARQQDMREALANVFRQLRWAIKSESGSTGGEQVDLISRLFYGKENIITLNDNGEKAIEAIPFHSLYVIPDESYENIYAMLDGAYGFRNIADESSQKHRSQYSTFSDLPPVIHIDVAVTAWDKEAQHAVRRAPFKVAESFYMDRYVDNPESVETRRRVSELMSKLADAKDVRSKLSKNDLGMDLPNALRSVGVYLGGLADQADNIGLDANMVPDSLIKNLRDLEDETSTQLVRVNNDIDKVTQELSRLVPNEGDLLYRLHAVCMHTGRADSGHYFIYIHDSTERRWYKYNDETVERIENTQPILDPNGGVRDGIPAMLVYVRETELNSLMGTVCREPEQSAEDPGPTKKGSPPFTKSPLAVPEWDIPRPEWCNV